MNEKTVMMIDDDQDTLTLYQLSLRDSGFSSHFFTFDDAQAAINHLHACIEKQQSIPAYIIIDLNMPEISGFQFLSVFEEEFHPLIPDTKIITVTSSIRLRDKHDALKYKYVVDFISKPILKPYLLQLFKD